MTEQLDPRAAKDNDVREDSLDERNRIEQRSGDARPRLGVFQSSPVATATAVESALRAGYRLIDTAAVYLNEREVGEGLRRSDVPRDRVFVETKVWVSDFGYDETLHAFEKSAQKLGLDQLDLLIVHQPAPDRFDTTIATYKALETLLADGRVRAIGVSNLKPTHLERLVNETDVVPTVNQIELHPYFNDRETQTANAQLGILTQAWSPIGGITVYPRYGDERRSVMDDPTLVEIAQQREKTAAQVMLRWHLQQGRAAIPKSTDPSRIAENFNVFDFALNPDELARIDALDTNTRTGPDSDRPWASQNFELPIPEV